VGRRLWTPEENRAARLLTTSGDAADGLQVCDLLVGWGGTALGRRELLPAFRSKMLAIALRSAGKGAETQSLFVWAAIFCIKFRVTGE
jgi:hypothetical protein